VINFILLEIYDMNINNGQYINLDVNINYKRSGRYYFYCTFNSKDELILYGLIKSRKIILICSTQTKNNKWKCKRMYEIPYTFKFISISRYDRLYFYLNNFIYEWDLLTEKCVKIFGSNELKHRDEKFFNQVINI
jgi:hypothetical protein